MMDSLERAQQRDRWQALPCDVRVRDMTGGLTGERDAGVRRNGERISP